VRPTGRRRRSEHRAQAGLSFIEIIIAMFLLGLAVVALVDGLATAQRSAGISTDQAQLEASAREVGDFLRLGSPVTYTTCDMNGTTLDKYGLRFTPGLGSAFTDKWKPVVIEVAEASSASITMTGSSRQSVQAEVLTCPGTSSIGDWGTQRITFQVTSPSTGRTLARAVFKWDPNPSPAP
jgi:Tfp pilus assembly protein PilV